MYGITVEEYDRMYKSCGGRCEICGRAEEDAVKGRLHVDHCHDTGVVRGLLCSHCNTALGKFQDSPELLTAAIRYIAGY